MAKHGESKHFKRSVVTTSVVIPRKKYKYYIRAMPGKHSSKEAVALVGILRDVMKVANNAREALFLIKSGQVKIDGKIAADPKMAVGFGDHIWIEGDEFIVSINNKGKLFVEENKDDPTFKKLKLVAKTKFKGGKTMFSFNDSRNVLADEDKAQVGDTVIFNLVTNTIEKTIPFEQGRNVLVFKGKNAGKTGKIIAINNGQVTLEKDGESFTAFEEACFAL